MPTPILPALSASEWHRRRSGCVHVEIIDDETHIVVADPDGQLVSVSGANELFALMALTNVALPPDDPRKVARGDLAILDVLIDQIERRHPSDIKLLALA